MSDPDTSPEAATRLYGIKTCDTCRAALKAFKDAGKDVDFVDVRANPPSGLFLEHLLSQHGEAALNRRSTTWRQLDATARENPPRALLEAHPTLMKRPVIEQNGSLYLGWTEAVRAAVLG